MRTYGNRSCFCLLLLCLIGLLRPSAAQTAARQTEARVWPIPGWTTATPESQGLDSTKLDALRAYFEEKKTRAALVIRHGRIVGEWYWDGRDKDSKFPAYSVTKSFSSTAVGLLVGDGKVKLEQPAADFLSSWKTDDRKNITLRHLITMTSGIKLEDLGYHLRPDRVTKALDQPLQYPPGTKWEYNNVACNTLSEIVTKASGEEMGDYLKHRLYEPLGMKNVSMDKSGSKTLAYMGLQISARDLAKVGYLFLNKGLWNGKRILSEEWVRMATTQSQDLQQRYGFLWWVNTDGENKDKTGGMYEAIGLYGNHLTVLPAQDMIVVRLIGNGAGAPTDVESWKLVELAREAVKPTEK
jgi:CubicO group peptidase (beta-lactamase class C family)